jgi:glycosyltransferase involved in cell wall biosynthesis
MLASVVVPTYLRPDFLDRCLEALISQEFDSGSFEIIVADDAGSYATQRQVEASADRSAILIHYVSPTSAHGPAAARNAGWRIARGEIVAFTDDDCIPDPRWLAEGIGAFASGAAAV